MVAIHPSELSHRIGRGRTAEIFRLHDGRIIKLLSPGVPKPRAERELRFAQQAAAADLPVWQVEKLVRCDERWGIVGEALPQGTSSLIKRLIRRPWEMNHWFGAFVDLHRKINDTSGAGFPPIRKRLARRIRSSGLPREAMEAALKELRRLPDGNALCHGDLHPANLLVTEGRLLAIDWASAGRGPRALDVARTIFLLRFGTTPGFAARFIGPLGKHYASRYQARRLEEEGLNPTLLEAWRVPIMAARLVRKQDSERDYFRDLLQAELSPADPPPARRPDSLKPDHPEPSRMGPNRLQKVAGKAVPSQSRKEASRP